MRVACCQLDIVWENKAANYSKVRTMVEAAKLPPRSLLVLPELFAVGFSMNISEIDDSRSNQTQRFLSGLAEHFNLYVMGGAVLSENGKGRNVCLAFSPDGRELARYCKLQPFTLAGEAQHYIAGTELVTFQCDEFKIAPFICYDLRFPEIFRQAAIRGAQIITVIANWPNRREHHWVTLLKARAIENQAYVVGVNRCGNDPQFQYSGRSLIVDPHGIVIAEADATECVLTADIDVAAVNDWRRDFPALTDIRPDFIP